LPLAEAALQEADIGEGDGEPDERPLRPEPVQQRAAERAAEQEADDPEDRGVDQVRNEASPEASQAERLAVHVHLRDNIVAQGRPRTARGASWANRLPGAHPWTPGSPPLDSREPDPGLVRAPPRARRGPTPGSAESARPPSAIVAADGWA